MDEIAEGVQACEASLTIFTERNMPLLAAMTQLNLAIALENIGSLSSNAKQIDDATHLLRAVASFGRPSILSATAQIHLGIDLAVLAGMDKDNSKLPPAKAYCADALKAFDKSDASPQWALAQFCIGLVFLSYKDHASIVQALATFESVLESPAGKEGSPLHDKAVSLVNIATSELISQANAAVTPRR